MTPLHCDIVIALAEHCLNPKIFRQLKFYATLHCPTGEQWQANEQVENIAVPPWLLPVLQEIQARPVPRLLGHDVVAGTDRCDDVTVVFKKEPA